MFDNGEYLHSRVACKSQNFYYTTLCIAPIRRPFRDFQNNFLIGNGAAKVFAQHINIPANMFIIRRHESKLFILFEQADDPPISPTDNAQYFPFRTMALSVAVDAGHDPVIIHRAVQFARRNKDIRAFPLIIRDNKTKALAA